MAVKPVFVILGISLLVAAASAYPKKPHHAHKNKQNSTTTPVPSNVTEIDVINGTTTELPINTSTTEISSTSLSPNVSTTVASVNATTVAPSTTVVANLTTKIVTTTVASDVTTTTDLSSEKERDNGPFGSIVDSIKDFGNKVVGNVAESSTLPSKIPTTPSISDVSKKVGSIADEVLPSTPKA